MVETKYKIIFTIALMITIPIIVLTFLYLILTYWQFGMAISIILFAALCWKIAEALLQ